MSSSDLNGKQAAFWSRADDSKMWTSAEPHDNAQLLSYVKDAVSVQLNLLRSSKNDDAYRNIVDLVMLRVNAALKDFTLPSQDADADAVAQAICKQLDDVLSKKYADMQSCSVKDAANEIVHALQDIVMPQDKHDEAAQSNEKDISSENDNNEEDVAEAADDVSSSSSQNAKFGESIQLETVSFDVVSLNAGMHMRRLSELCSGKATDYSQLKADAKAVKMSHLNVSNHAQKQLPVKPGNTSKDAQQAANAKSAADKKSRRLPVAIVKSDIYKHSGTLFYGMHIKSAMFSFALVAAFKKRTEATLPCMKELQDNVCASAFDAEDKLCDIYEKLPKSLLERLMDFIKQKLVGQLLKPLKKKLSDFLLKQFMPGWMKRFVDTCQSFIEPVVDKFVAKMKSLGDRISRGIKAISRLLAKTASTAFKLFKAALSGVMSLIKFTLRTTFKALTHILTFALTALRAIFKFIYNGIKFIGQLFSKTKLGKFFSRMAGKVRNAIKKVAEGIQKACQKIGRAFSKMWNALKSGFSKLKNALRNGMKRAMNAVKNVIKKVATKIFNVVKGTIRKAVQKIMQKLGLKIAKKVAKKRAQSLLMMGAKKIFKFFKSWVTKIIQKLATKIAGAAAANVVPILGQIVSAAMMIYTIVDTIYTFYEVYKFMKEEPAAWDFIKEEVAKWAAKAFNFIDGLRKKGKQLFYKLFIDGPKKLAKKVAHLYNFLLNPLSSAEKMLKNAAYARELIAIRDKNLIALNAMEEKKRAEFLKSNTKKLLEKVESLRSRAEKLTIKIEKEQSSWWPSNKKIIGWIDERQSIYRQMMDFASRVGLSSFASGVCKDASDVIDEYEKKQALIQQITARRRQMQLQYENKQIDMEALQQICKEHKDKSDELHNGIESLNNELEKRAIGMMSELEQLQDSQQEDEEHNFVIAV